MYKRQDWHQTAYNDHSCYTICDKILIDACPSVITQLLEHDVDPLGIRTVCFTHMHCDQMCIRDRHSGRVV